MCSKIRLISVFLLICVISNVNCGGDYSSLFQESFYSLMSSKQPQFLMNKESKSSGDHPPFCNGNGKFVEGVNEIGSCSPSCPDGYEKHFFIEIVNGQEEEFCCCGECS